MKTLTELFKILVGGNKEAKKECDPVVDSTCKDDVAETTPSKKQKRKSGRPRKKKKEE